jgi:uncharacterized protein (DUF427 family)
LGRTEAAWYYPKPSPAASHFKGQVAFWGGVKVQQVSGDGEEEPNRVVKSVFGALFKK